MTLVICRPARRRTLLPCEVDVYNRDRDDLRAAIAAGVVGRGNQWAIGVGRC